MNEIKKVEDQTQISRLEPKTLRFVRKLNIGNYENIDIGGEFFVPEGMTIEEAQIAILDHTQKEVERWVEATKDKPYARDHSKILEKYKEELAEYQGKSKSLVSKNLIIAQVETVITLIGNFKDLVSWNLNNKVENLFETLDELFDQEVISREEFRALPHHRDIPDKFKFVIDDLTKPEPGPDSEEEHEPIHATDPGPRDPNY